MTILFMGGEMASFTPSDADSFEYQADMAGNASYDSSFARCCLAVRGSASYSTSPVFSTTADIWLHFETNQDAPTASATLATICTLLDSGGTERIRIQTSTAYGGLSQTWQIGYWTGAAWANLGSSFTVSHNLQTVDINIVSNTASGSGTVYISGTQRVTGSADLSAFSGIAQYRAYGKTVGIATGVAHSQVVGANEPTIGWRLATFYTSGAGATSTWTGTYAGIDEVVYDDADFVLSGTATQVSTFAATGPSMTGYAVRAVGIYARARRGVGGPQNLQLVLRSAGTDYFSGSKALSVGYDTYGNIWETDPATSAAFLSSAIATLQPGVKSIA